MKHESTPFVRFFLLASVVLCGVFAKAGNPIPDNPNENDDPYSAPTVCGNSPGPESPPKEVAGNPGAPGCTTCSDDATHTAVGSISVELRSWPKRPSDGWKFMRSARRVSRPAPGFSASTIR